MFICNLCNKPFKTKHGLKGHLNKKIPCNLEKYQCKKCFKVFKTKQILTKHYNRKIPCTKNNIIEIIPNYSKETPNYSKKTPNYSKMELEGGLNIIKKIKPKCEYCNKFYSTKYNLNKHFKICKSKLLYEKTQSELQMKYNCLMNEIEILKKEKSNHIINNTENNITINSTINNNTQNNINITVNPFGNEIYDYLSDKSYRCAINSRIGGIVKLIKDINFNTAYPQNHNVYIPNKKDKYAMIYNGNKWILNKKDDVIDNLINNNFLRINNYYEENNNKLSIKEKQNIEKLNKMIIDGQPKQLQDSIYLVLYNNRDLISKDGILVK